MLGKIDTEIRLSLYFRTVAFIGVYTINSDVVNLVDMVPLCSGGKGGEERDRLKEDIIILPNTPIYFRLRSSVYVLTLIR